MKRMIVLAASLTVALGSSMARPQSTPVDLRGIYVGGNNIIRENPTPLAAALKVPGVDGLLLNIGWDETEPVMGQYQWTTLDQWISQAISDGKKITVSVGAAMRTPSWLFQPPPDGAGATPCTDATYLDILQTGISPLGLSNCLRAQYLEVFAPDAGVFPDDIQKAHVALAPDTLAIELAKQKGSGKLVVYVASTDPNAALSICGRPGRRWSAGDRPRSNVQDGSNGNEFFLVKKGLLPVGSVQVTSTSRGSPNGHSESASVWE
jgi:hypothetical protein